MNFPTATVRNTNIGEKKRVGVCEPVVVPLPQPVPAHQPVTPVEPETTPVEQPVGPVVDP